jgi:hypothetical protein
MGWVGVILRKVVHLFVDDGPFALSIVAWVAVVWLLTTFVHTPALLALALWAGLVGILLESCIRRGNR